ncbi:Cro/CI family transcriptional regulator [Hafnia paralvei]|uniref:Cro/CI family transcriptional regulator n=1 Tax=Hafnia paralvei TaxID=546367 RepID=UPI00241D3D05|nr:Cro/CI family transcriptional regulator [Hafnia paralvei]
MHKQDVTAHFGSGIKTAEALGVSKSTVSLWKDVIPWKYALLVEKVTEGRLKYDPALYSGNHKSESNK